MTQSFLPSYNTIHLEIYKPTVMFFSLTNLLATFQTMINDILRDLIDTGNITAFMDDVLVKIENKKKHNEIVEVLRRTEANDLYMKPKKYV